MQLAVYNGFDYHEENCHEELKETFYHKQLSF